MLLERRMRTIQQIQVRTSLHRVDQVAAVNFDARNTVVFSLLVYIHVCRHIGCERVDSAPIVDDKKQQRQIFLGSGIEAFSHSAVLRPALANEYDRNAVVTLETLRVKLPIEQNGTCRASGIGKLLRNKRPTSLKVCLLVVDVLLRGAHTNM